MLWLASPPFFVSQTVCLAVWNKRDHFRLALGSSKRKIVYRKMTLSFPVWVMFKCFFFQFLCLSPIKASHPAGLIVASLSLPATPVLHLTVHVATMDELLLNYYIPVFQ